MLQGLRVSYRNGASVMQVALAATGQQIHAAAGEQVKLDAGGELTAEPTVEVKGRDVHLGCSLTDAHGNKVAAMEINAKRPPVPVIRVLDESGKIVHQARLKYG